MKKQKAFLIATAFAAILILLGCSSDSSNGTSGEGGISLSGTISYENGNNHVVVFLCEHPFPQDGEPVLVASDFSVLTNGTAEYQLSGFSAGTYDLLVWIDIDSSNNGEFQPPTLGDKMLANPYYVTVDVSGHETMNFSSFPVTWPDAVEYNVPTLTIFIDGNPADWTIPPAVSDEVGDDTGSNSGTDLQYLYIAKDAQNLYIRIDLADGGPNSALPVYYGISFDDNIEDEVGDPLLFNHFGGIWYANVDIWTGFDPASHTTSAFGQIAIGSGWMEMSYPLSALGYPTGVSRFMEASDNPGGMPFDSMRYVRAIFP